MVITTEKKREKRRHHIDPAQPSQPSQRSSNQSSSSICWGVSLRLLYNRLPGKWAPSSTAPQTNDSMWHFFLINSGARYLRLSLVSSLMRIAADDHGPFNLIVETKNSGDCLDSLLRLIFLVFCNSMAAPNAK